jgi:hypothetical protein
LRGESRCFGVEVSSHHPDWQSSDRLPESHIFGSNSVQGETDVELGLGRGLCVLETEISKSVKSVSESMPDSSVSMRNDTLGRLAVSAGGIVATALASNHPLLQRVDLAGNETGKGKKKPSGHERIAGILMSRDERRELMFSVRDGGWRRSE